MEFIHSVYREWNTAPTKETFIRADDLNATYEYPLQVNEGFWLSPIRPCKTGVTSPWIDYAVEVNMDYSSKPKHFYMLDPDAKIYHFHSVADYLGAIARFPKNMNGTSPDVCPRREYIDGLMDKLASVVSMEKEFDDMNTKKKLKKLDDLRYIILHRHGNYKPLDDFSDGYTERAFGELKRHINKMMLKFSAEIKDCVFSYASNKLDFNRMRDDGYVGFYVHQVAIDEANSISKLAPYYSTVSPLKFWGAESMCVWDWCFIDT